MTLLSASSSVIVNLCEVQSLYYVITAVSLWFYLSLTFLWSDQRSSCKLNFVTASLYPWTVRTGESSRYSQDTAHCLSCSETATTANMTAVSCISQSSLIHQGKTPDLQERWIRYIAIKLILERQQDSLWTLADDRQDMKKLLQRSRKSRQRRNLFQQVQMRLEKSRTMKKTTISL